VIGEPDLERAMPRDTGRLERAMRAHTRLVWRLLRRSGLSDRDADEAAQDVFWVLCRRMQDVPLAAEKSFLISTALRVASDRRRAEPSRTEVELDPEMSATGVDMEEMVTLRRARRLLDEALGCLTWEQRTVFVLIEMEQMTEPEVAGTLAIPLGTVASRLRSARQNFDAAIRRLHSRERTRTP
jgi:RNA polymerase sigma-70 factor (ECF subfamily)